MSEAEAAAVQEKAPLESTVDVEAGKDEVSEADGGSQLVVEKEEKEEKVEVAEGETDEAKEDTNDGDAMSEQKEEDSGVQEVAGQEQAALLSRFKHVLVQVIQERDFYEQQIQRLKSAVATEALRNRELESKVKEMWELVKDERDDVYRKVQQRYSSLRSELFEAQEQISHLESQRISQLQQSSEEIRQLKALVAELRSQEPGERLLAAPGATSSPGLPSARPSTVLWETDTQSPAIARQVLTSLPRPVGDDVEEKGGAEALAAKAEEQEAGGETPKEPVKEKEGEQEKREEEKLENVEQEEQEGEEEGEEADGEAEATRKAAAMDERLIRRCDSLERSMAHDKASTQAARGAGETLVMDGEEIAACTLVRLVEHLTGDRSVPLGQIRAFMLSFRAFATVEEVLDALRVRYDSLVRNDMNHNSVLHGKLLRLVELRIANLTKYWVTNHFDDFMGQPERVAALNALVDLVLDKQFGNIGELLKRSVVSGPAKSFEAVLEVPKSCTEQLHDRSLLNFSPAQIAGQVGLVDHFLFASIRLEHLLVDPEKEMEPMTRRRKDLEAAFAPCLAPDNERHAKVAGVVVTTAKLLYDANDWFGAKVLLDVLAGVDCTSLPAESAATLASLKEEFGEHLADVRRCRVHFATLQTGVPPVETYLERLQELAQLPDTSVAGEQMLVNWTKFRQMAGVVQNWPALQHGQELACEWEAGLQHLLAYCACRQ